MSKTNADKIQAELMEIAKRNGGAISPHAVVEFARNKKTALHSRFTWDDTKAAQEYRLYEARQLLRVYVTVLDGSTAPVRAFVSLPEDRSREAGYRPIATVMSSEERRASLLAMAFAELEVFRHKYAALSELAEVFSAIDRARRSDRRRSVVKGAVATA